LIVRHEGVLVPDGDNQSIFRLGDASSTSSHPTEIRHVRLRVIPYHHEFYVAHTNASRCGVAITFGAHHGTLELIYMDVSDRPIVLFEGMLVLLEARPVRSVGPTGAINTVNSSMLAHSSDGVLLLFEAVSVLESPDVRVPSIRH
jgi:hypothetical protein